MSYPTPAELLLPEYSATKLQAEKLVLGSHGRPLADGEFSLFQACQFAGNKKPVHDPRSELKGESSSLLGLFWLGGGWDCPSHGLSSVGDGLYLVLHEPRGVCETKATACRGRNHEPCTR